jgi:hypothetical protein
MGFLITIAIRKLRSGLTNGLLVGAIVLKVGGFC